MGRGPSLAKRPLAPLSRTYVPGEIARADRFIARMYLLQRHHQRLLCFLYRTIERERPICLFACERDLGISRAYLEELRGRYPETFRLMSAYEHARRLWAEGRQRNGTFPGDARRERERRQAIARAKDPLLAQLERVPA